MSAFQNIITKSKWSYRGYNSGSGESAYLMKDFEIAYKAPDILYDDIMALITYLCNGVTSSIFYYNYHTCTLILDKITEKWKIQKKELTKIFTVIKKLPTGQNIKLSFKWVDNLESLGVELSIDQRVAITAIGYIKSYKDMGLGFDRKEFDAMFTSVNHVTKMFAEKENFKHLVTQKNFLLSHENFVSMLGLFSMSDKNTASSYTQILNFFLSHEYKFTENDFIDTIHSIRGTTTPLTSGNLANFTTELLIDIVQFFRDNGVHPSTDIIFKEQLPSIYDYYASKEFKLTTLIGLDLLQKKELGSKDMVKLLLSPYSQPFKNKLFEYFDFEFTSDVIKFIILLNMVNLIPQLQLSGKLNLVELDFVFKYACLNNNKQLIQYCLDQKYTPRTEHVLYLMLSGQTSNTKREIMPLLISYGLMVNDKVYELLSYCNPSYSAISTINFNNVDPLKQSELNLRISQSSDGGYASINSQTLCSHYRTIGTKTLELIAFTENINNIIKHIVLNNVIPTQEFCENITIYRCHEPVLLEFLNDFFGYIPSLYCILRVPNIYVRCLYAKKYHNINFEYLNENKFVLPKNELVPIQNQTTNKVNQHTEENTKLDERLDEQFDGQLTDKKTDNELESKELELKELECDLPKKVKKITKKTDKKVSKKIQKS